MTADELREEMAKFRSWYHKIPLGNGVITPGLDFDDMWALVRKSRAHVDYAGKRVLDIASFDGMWAFEAEQLGSALVVATDCLYESFKNFLFCHRQLNSRVIPYYNVSPYSLADRLDVFLQENWEQQKPDDRLFDVVHHLGLLYHLRDPLLSLSQARSVMRAGGQLLIETAVVINEDASFMLFNGVPPDRSRFYDDLTTWWAPTIPCLHEMLRASLFEPLPDTTHVLATESLSNRLWAQARRVVRRDRYAVSRVCLVARAMSPQEVDPAYLRELARTYRNPGLAIHRLGL